MTIGTKEEIEDVLLTVKAKGKYKSQICRL